MFKFVLSYTFLIICCLQALPAWSQGQGEAVRCYTAELDQKDRALHPEMPSEAEFEAWLRQRVRSWKAQASSSREVITIPIVVHVIHSGELAGEGHNISQAQIVSQIEVLNEDFRRLPNTPGFNSHPDGADIEIEFCLAETNEQGEVLSEPGIDRIDRNDFGFAEAPYTDTYVDQTIKPPTIWDPYRYLNVWTCLLSNSILGFARYPVASTLPGINSGGTSDLNDGVVISYNVFGRGEGNLRSPYDQGRSATHEIGHWLGLKHIWGDGGCGVDDYCEDTPDADDPHYDCPTSVVSCGSADMFDNYMDYTDDACMSIFTQDQKARMLTVLANSPRRKELLDSRVCVVKAEAPIADFTVDSEGGCPGLVVRYRDNSTNRPSRWQWYFPGGSPDTSSSPNPVITYPRIGSFGATLILSNDYGVDTLTIENLLAIEESATPSTFYFESFENGFEGWEIENPDSREGWQLTSSIAGSRNGRHAMYMNCFDYRELGERDGLISPVLDLRGKSNILLSFEHAYRRFDEDSKDSLIVYVSTDAGVHFDQRVLARAENGLGSFATNSSQEAAFIPQRDEDWCYDGTVGTSCFEIDLNAYSGQKNFRFKFESYNNFGNNMYLDNVSLSGSCGTETKSGEITFDLFPNPNPGKFTISVGVKSEGEAILELIDLAGRRIFQQIFAVEKGNFEQEMEIPGLASGTYLLLLRTPDGKGYRKMLIWE